MYAVPAFPAALASDYLTAGMHDAAVADESKQHGHRQVSAENARTQICIRNRPPPGEAEM